MAVIEADERLTNPLHSAVRCDADTDLYLILSCKGGDLRDRYPVGVWTGAWVMPYRSDSHRYTGDAKMAI